MRKNYFLEANKIIFFALFITVISISISFSILISNQVANLSKKDLDWKFLLSFILWISLNIFLVSKKYRLFILPVLVLAVPGLVDNLMPSVLIGPEEEINANLIPIISYMDISLIWMLILNIYDRKKSFSKTRIKIVNKNPLLLLIILFFLVCFNYGIHSIFNPDFSYKIGLIDVFDFLRLILIYINLEMLVKEFSDVLKIIYGMIISILLLIFDSSFYTLFIIKANRLTAGTLGRNVFGNILAVISIIFLSAFIKAKKNQRKIFLFAFLITLLMTLLTQTRVSLAVLLIGISLFYIISSKKRLTKKILKIALVWLFIIAIYITLSLKGMTDYQRVTSIIQNMGDLNLEYSQYTSTFFTRLKLIKISIAMFVNNPFFGIGPNHWNMAKYNYGYEQKVMLRVHNGYLLILSQHGIIFFLFYILLLFIVFNKIFFILKKPLLDQKIRIILIGFWTGFCMWLITELFNCGIGKNRISAFIVILIYVIYNYRKFNHIGNEINKVDNHDSYE